jgi:hypothetical protein
VCVREGEREEHLLRIVGAAAVPDPRGDHHRISRRHERQHGLPLRQRLASSAVGSFCGSVEAPVTRCGFGQRARKGDEEERPVLFGDGIEWQPDGYVPGARVLERLGILRRGCASAPLSLHAAEPLSPRLTVCTRKADCGDLDGLEMYCSLNCRTTHQTLPCSRSRHAKQMHAVLPDSSVGPAGTPARPARASRAAAWRPRPGYVRGLSWCRRSHCVRRTPCP